MGINQNNYEKLWLFIAITGIFLLFPLPWVHVVKEKELLDNREKISDKL